MQTLPHKLMAPKNNEQKIIIENTTTTTAAMLNEYLPFVLTR